MKLYLDNSFLNRPFDDPRAGMNSQEGAVLYEIIRLTKEGKVQLVNSTIVEVENAANEIAARKTFVASVMYLSASYQSLNDSIVDRVEKLVREYHLQPLDAVHLASAEAAQVDFFITCDYTVSKRYRGMLHIITPLQFQQHYENHN
jgi:predicted nucleic acid-binding protein